MKELDRGVFTNLVNNYIVDIINNLHTFIAEFDYCTLSLRILDDYAKLYAKIKFCITEKNINKKGGENLLFYCFSSSFRFFSISLTRCVTQSRDRRGSSGVLNT